MTSPTDGRLLRGVRTRTSIVQALLDLVTEGVRSPTAAEIAQRAGVSVRSVFQHFEDLEALYTDLVAEQSERIAPLVGSLRPGGELDERVDALVDHRRTLFETITPVRRAITDRADSSPALRTRLDELDRTLRRQVEAHFAAELTGGPEVVEVVDLLTSFDGWARLRDAQGLSPDRAAAALQASLMRLLR